MTPKFTLTHLDDLMIFGSVSQGLNLILLGLSSGAAQAQFWSKW